MGVLTQHVLEINIAALLLLLGLLFLLVVLLAKNVVALFLFLLFKRLVV